LNEYLNEINNFYELKHTFIKKNLSRVYNSEYLNKKKKLNYHFMFIKKKYINFLKYHKSYLNNQINTIKNIINDKIDILLSDIMEWYIIAKIYEIRNDNKNIIIHTGKYHYENLIDFLMNIYEYKISDNFDDIQEIGCVNIIDI
jgi:hypothetical protein